MPKDDLANLRLDLAPKLNRPLSLWNPLDYLRLLFWVFYSPRSLEWYINSFSRDTAKPNNQPKRTWPQNMLKNKPLLNLVTHSILVILVITILNLILLMKLRTAFAWEGALLLSFLATFAAIFQSRSRKNPSEKIALFVAVSTTSFLVGGLLSTRIQNSFLFLFLPNRVALIVLGISVGIVTSIMASFHKNPKRLFFRENLDKNASFFVTASLINGALILILLYFGFIGSILVFSFVFISVFRPDSLILGIALNLIHPKIFFPNVSSITLVPFPFLAKNIQNSFSKDWSLGIHNLNQILRYTNQSIAATLGVSNALYQVKEEDLIIRISQVVQSLHNWDLIPNCVFLYRRRKREARLYSIEVLSGFWYLHDEQPAKATRAFAVVHNIRYGGEMHGLASLLTLFDAAKTAEQIAAIDLPELPIDRTLRSQTWEAIRRFCHTISDTKTVHYSKSRSARAFASNRALGELQNILDHKADLPEAERGLVINIARTWQSALLEITAEVGEAAITQPVQNPYVIGDPVEGDLFVGRDDIMRQLQELWLMGNHLQSVVIYGHRRMGKTSILKNVAQVLGSGLRVAYVNLLKSAGADNLSDVLLSISDQVAATLAIPPPSDAEMTTSPARTFERFLRRATNGLAEGEGLIIALDEFEKIEELIEAGKLDASFMAYLRGLVQDSPKVSFAFAGLHTLQEMSADYFQPFFASVIPIKVDFFKPATVQTLLPNPGGEFPLDYDYEALDLIYELTAGQPYLTQLLGFQLVRRYNDQVFEQQQKREAKFTVLDVQAVAERPEFFAQGKPYFAGVWAQASHDAPGQQTLLKTLSPHPEGLELDRLQHDSELDQATFAAALETLANHDVVRVTNGTAKIIVEVFRRWVAQQAV